MSFVLILYFDWLLGPHKGQNFEKKKHSKIFSSETVKGMNPVLCIHVPDSSLYIICVFYFSGIRTLDPVVQSIVCLTISLRHKFVKQISAKVTNTLLFFVEKK